MLPRRIASRYAQALFTLAQQQGTVEAWEGELATLAAVIADTPDFSALLTHPEVSLARKHDVLVRAFGGKVAPEVLAVLTLLIRRGHEPEMGVVHEIYVHLWHDAQRVMPATVVSAQPLDAAQASALTAALVKRTGRTVTLTQQVDPALLSGLIITVGDRIIDASGRTALDELRTTLMQG
jgi:F-type H+-transporting ATPase subunit delta